MKELQDQVFVLVRAAFLERDLHLLLRLIYRVRALAWERLNTVDELVKKDA